MDIVLVILFLLLICSIKLRKDEGGELSPKSLLPVRGICAIAVVMHHISQKTTGELQYIFHFFNDVGYLCVAVFFAISGYALSVQYDKNSNYLKGFLKKRYTQLFLPYIFTTLAVLVFYVVLDVVNGNNILQQMASRVFDMFRYGVTILPNSWYIEILAALYLLFYIVYKLFGQKKFLRFSLLLLGILIIMTVCKLLGYGVWWYNSILAFILGVLYYEYTISKFYKSTPKWFGIVVSVFFLCIINIIFRRSYLILTELSACICAVLVFQFLRILKFNSKILDYIGSRSYEIYLCHGIPMLFIQQLNIEINDILYFIIVAIISIIMAELLHRICKKMLLSNGT